MRRHPKEGRTADPGMLSLLWKFSRGYRLTPWKSPYVRWRIETFWGLHADEISPGQFWKFVWERRSDLIRYLFWADRMR